LTVGRLQVQYALPKDVKPEYTGPIDCAKKVIKAKGIRGLYAGISGYITPKV
jgi:solute carrier family 25 carnitine/acylcarnitine transporter 20/29